MSPQEFIPPESQQVSDTNLIELNGLWLIVDKDGLNKVKNKHSRMYVAYATQEDALHALKLFGYEEV